MSRASRSHAAPTGTPAKKELEGCSDSHISIFLIPVCSPSPGPRPLQRAYSLSPSPASAPFSLYHHQGQSALSPRCRRALRRSSSQLNITAEDITADEHMPQWHSPTEIVKDGGKPQQNSPADRCPDVFTPQGSLPNSCTHCAVFICTSIAVRRVLCADVSLQLGVHNFSLV